MRIAFISYEYPPDTASGGIGTYLVQVLPRLVAAGAEVEIFAATKGAEAYRSVSPEGVVSHRIPTKGSTYFRDEVVATFVVRHREAPFDVVESADFDGWGLGVRRALPDLPHIVKLHTPRYVVDRLMGFGWSPRKEIRSLLGQVRRGRFPRFDLYATRANLQCELEALRTADLLASPSQAVGDRVAADLGGRTPPISVFPYPYSPSARALATPLETDSATVLFVGRLETRKGVEELARAVPRVVDAVPRARFRMIGNFAVHRASGRSMQDHLTRTLGSYARYVEMPGPLPPEKVQEAYEASDVCVFPSHWESFGLVCCEAMANGRPVVGSQNGGMREILDGGRAGTLVDPMNVRRLADAIIALLRSPARRAELGTLGRQRLAAWCVPEIVIPKQMRVYEETIARKRRATVSGKAVQTA